MNFSAAVLRAVLALVSCVGAVSTAQARNDLLLRPLADALKQPHVVEILGDLPVRFGAATARQADVSAVVLDTPAAAGGGR